YVQLLGGDPDCMALNARTVEALGAPGIDLNFGCPSKTVNRNDGGSTLLREPERVHRIVASVRQAVSPTTPVTAKIRLGFYDSSLLEDIACGIEAAQASELCIHARTRLDGYRPPAYWEQIRRVRALVKLPLIANGEIWTPADARSAQQESGCVDLMLGRGALSRPDLALAIRRDQAQPGPAATYRPPLCWPQIQALLHQHSEVMARNHPRYAVSRIKQWLTYLRRQYPEAEQLFQRLKRLPDIHPIQQILALPEPQGLPHEQ
nr:tRNA-dihydrouridine synthase family protein [Thiolinea sp.]